MADAADAAHTALASHAGLAFDHAARLYRTALELHSGTDEQAHPLRRRLAGERCHLPASHCATTAAMNSSVASARSKTILASTGP